MKLYRFELALNGVPQGIDALCGLKNIPLSTEQADLIFSGFSGLRTPVLKEPAACFFTESGIHQYEEAIAFMNWSISTTCPHWEVVGTAVEATDVDMLSALHQDDVQIYLRSRWLEKKNLRYVTISTMQAFYHAVSNRVMFRFQEEIDRLTCPADPKDVRQLAQRVEAAYSSERTLCGMEFDELMSQLFERSEEEILRMGYDYR